MLNVDDFIDNTFEILDYYGIPSSLFAFIFISLITFYLVYKLRKIDKNENIFKIMFSEKYNEDFGDNIIGKFNNRHQFIIEFFCILLTNLVSLVILIYEFIVWL